MKRIIHKIKSSQDGRVVASNFVYLTLLQFSGYVFPLITVPYLARVIGVEKIGEIAFASAVILWLKTVAEWGFNYTATRDVARCRDDAEQVSKILSNVLWARCFLAIGCFLLLWLATEHIAFLKNKQLLLFVTFLLIPGDILFPSWFFQALERMRYITIFGLLSKIIFTAAVFIFIQDRNDYILQPLLISIGALVSGFLSIYFIYFKWGYRLYKPNFQQILAIIKGSSDVFLNTLIPNLYNSFSTVLLGAFHGGIANGLLDAGTKFVGLAQQVLRTLSRAFFPFLSRKISQHNIYATLTFSTSVVFSVLLFFLAPYLIGWFYTPEFDEAIIVLRITAVSVVFLSFNNIFGVNYLILKGYERELRNITFYCSISGFIIAWPLIYFYGFIGAALTITFTRIILGTSIMMGALKRKRSEL